MREIHVSIVDYIEHIKDYLDGYFKGSYGVSYHSDVDPKSGENTAVPDVYAGLMPSTAINEDYPSRCPCIVITWDSMTGEGVYNITLHLCVGYAAIADAEKVKPAEGKPGFFEYVDGESYDTNADYALWKASAMFSEDVFKAMSNDAELGMQNAVIEPVDASLPDYPYAISQIHFEIVPNRQKVGMQMRVEEMY